jgi:hypothetical protein
MKAKCALLFAIAGWCAAPASANPIAMQGKDLDLLRDWDHPYKWDQLYPDPTAGHSTIDDQMGIYSTTADDWLCTRPSYLTAVHFAGFSYYGNDYIDGFRITVWSDVPSTIDDESHPGDALWSYDCYDTWLDLGDGTFDVNIPRDLWFWQEGTANDPIVYWISVQGLMAQDGADDHFYWNFLDRNLVDMQWNDAAAFESSYFGYAPWHNWGWFDPNTVDLFDGPFPIDWWQRADMAFALTFPQPTTILLLGISGLIASRRR